MGSPYPFPFLFGNLKAKWIYLHTGDVVVNNTPANAGEAGAIPGLGRSTGVGNGTNSIILAWNIPRTSEPVGLQSVGLQSQIQLS